MKSNIKRIILASFAFVALSCSAAFATEVNSTDELSQAWLSTQSGDTITLTADLTIDSNYTLKGKEITLDLNGHVINRDLSYAGGDPESDGNIFTLEDGATLNIIDSNPSSTHTRWENLNGGLLCYGYGDGVGGCIQMEDNTTLNVTKGTFFMCSTNDHGGAIRTDGDGIVINLDSVTFNGNDTYHSSDNAHGGAIYIGDDCTLSCTSCGFYYNSSEDNGGAVYLDDDSYAEFYKCTFKSNYAKDCGGAVYQASSASVIFKNCKFQGNESTAEGGALYIDSGERTEINNCEFVHNKTQATGSAVYVNDDNNYFIDTKVCNNEAYGEDSGAIYVDYDDSIDIKGLMQVQYNGNNIFLAEHHYVFGICDVADIHNSGLTDGSYVGILCYNFDGEKLENVAEDQKQYFHADKSNFPIKWNDDEPNTNTGSVFSNSTGLLVAGTLVIIIAIVVILLAKKKKKA